VKNLLTMSAVCLLFLIQSVMGSEVEIQSISIQVNEIAVYPDSEAINTTFYIVDKNDYPPGTIVQQSEVRKRNLSLVVDQCTDDIEDAMQCSKVATVFSKRQVESGKFSERFFAGDITTIDLPINPVKSRIYLVLKDEEQVIAKQRLFFYHDSPQDISIISSGHLEKISMIEKMAQVLGHKKIFRGDVVVSLTID